MPDVPYLTNLRLDPFERTGWPDERDQGRRAAVLRLVQVRVLALRVRPAAGGEARDDGHRVPAHAEGRELAAEQLSSGYGERRMAKTKDKLTRKELRQGAREAARRAGQAAGVGEGQGAQGLHRLRGPRRRRQGRHHQGHHRAREPARLSRDRAAGADRAREEPDVPAALPAAHAGGRRSRDLGPQLVQPRGRRARDGLLPRGAREALPRAGAGVREAR